MTTDSRLILVGQVGGGFGVRGEVRVTAFTADPLALTAYGPLLRADGSVGLTLTSARPDKNGVVGRAKEIATKEQADALRGLKLHVPRDRFPEPEEDEFYLADLIGLQARDGDDAAIGVVKAVQNFGADDMLEIAPAAGGPTWYLPFTRDAVPDIRLAEGWLRVLRPVEVGEREPD
ncbi:MAG: 16S rRNA processing protein RimM [Brevundimonas sp.]|uniref:Ribosome maturation factor RimM n=1 Tax=Brevundimonas albigilva TaxID=1312364 RepID=A0ABY4SL98_9CAUL|nr:MULTISPECIES: ribosome maturation factor RimM [Brevundimonas]MCV0415514.1 ribosome maturation factor RimM [Brevundimonas sp.]PZU54282.1 MAG: 16S rRNA processing protein RimM [Brevundimonas sp.]URI15497.1 ribosome maturation factor RimM [Brevundimonas albigilva]